MYDYFIAELHCPHCATTSTHIDLQTHIRGLGADGSSLAVGYLFEAVELTPRHLAGAGYALISPPEDVMSPRLLDVWICPACETEQWASIQIVKQRIEGIAAVVLNKASFAASNYIDDTNAENRALTLMDLTWDEFSERKLDAVEVLRQRLE